MTEQSGWPPGLAHEPEPLTEPEPEAEVAAVEPEPEPEPEPTPEPPDPDWLVELRNNASPAAAAAGLEDVHRRLRNLER